MSRILILARESETIKELHYGLTRKGFTCSVIPHEENISTEVIASDLLLVEASALGETQLRQLSQRVKQAKAPIIVLVERNALATLDDTRIDDFIIAPYNLEELSLRVKRLLQRSERTESGNIIRSGDLVMDLAKCEVTLAGAVVDLTYKEYELLKFLMQSKGRVLTREVLLNEIWGYDYFGGDRTVDVHIRRLRSKIESTGQTFIETVRNIGYRFKTDGR